MSRKDDLLEDAGGSARYPMDIVAVRLVKDAPVISGKPLSSPEEAVRIMGGILSQFDREVVCLVNLKTDLSPINATFASVGSINAAVSEPRELLKAAILSNAAGMIMLHNHPSGNLVPSKEDTAITERLLLIGDLIGIPLYDHIIIGGNREQFYSFRQHKKIEPGKYSWRSEFKSAGFPALPGQKHTSLRTSVREKLEMTGAISGQHSRGAGWNPDKSKKRNEETL